MNVGALRVCIVSHHAYPAFSGIEGVGGGVEVQTSLLARWLAARGHDVSLITWNEGQAQPLSVDGVNVIAMCRRDAGIPGIRFFHPRWTSLLTALRQADAQVYYQNGAEYVTGQVALWCRANARRFVFSSASNADCDPALPFLPTRRERALYRMGLRRADAVLVQTTRQAQMLRSHFGHESTVVPMPCSDISPGSVATPGERNRVLWVGRICEVKRPDRLLDVAAACPNVHFDLVGADDGTSYGREVVARAMRAPNVVVHGARSRAEIGRLLARAVCLCCTSDLEGFPNTFLEAWSQGVPVLTTYDPDGLVATHELGWVVAPDAGSISERITSILAARASRDAASTRARCYFERHHTVDAAMPIFEAVFSRVVEAPRA